LYCSNKNFLHTLKLVKEHKKDLIKKMIFIKKVYLSMLEKLFMKTTFLLSLL